MEQDVAFCIAEDRPDAEPGVRIAIASIDRHMGPAPIFLYRPNPRPDFVAWLRRFPQVVLLAARPEGATSWNCKPQALLPLLDRGYRQVVWVDSDIVVTRDIRHEFSRLPDDTIVVTQEPGSLPRQGTRDRTAGWGLPVGRALPHTLNSCVLRFTRAHAALLERWVISLNHPDYLRAQTVPIADRPLHLAGDQDILNALVGSTEFAAFPVHILKSGVDIIHAGGALGYSLGERLAGVVRKKPAFFHATAGKPWHWLGNEEHPEWSRTDFFGWHRRLLQEISPYLVEARKYRNDLGMAADWMEKSSPIGTALRVLGLGHFALRGLPVTLFATALEALKPRQQRT